MALIYKSADDAYRSLKENFEKRVNAETRTGSVIDIYNKTIGSEIGEMYELILANKNPYLFTKAEDLDTLGYWFNLTRKEGEDDEHYKFRLKSWLLTSETSNDTAITNNLLNPQHASNLQYIPFSHGAGTASVIIIPKVYEEKSITEAVEEAHKLVKEITSPSLYVEYIVPAVLGVRLECYLLTSGDKDSIKHNITEKVREHINGIAPDKQLKIGDIIKIGLLEDGVEYFNVVTYFIDNEQQTELSKVQGLETKFLFDAIDWVDAIVAGI